MLKKAGILVAATAAGLLAVSPLAFAGDKGHDEGYHAGSEGDTVTVTDNFDIDDSIVGNDIADSAINNCENNQSSADASDSASGLLGLVSVLDNANVNALQCVNLLNNVLNDNNVGVDVL